MWHDVKWCVMTWNDVMMPRMASIGMPIDLHHHRHAYRLASSQACLSTCIFALLMRIPVCGIVIVVIWHADNMIRDDMISRHMTCRHIISIHAVISYLYMPSYHIYMWRDMRMAIHLELRNASRWAIHIWARHRDMTLAIHRHMNEWYNERCPYGYTLCVAVCCSALQFVGDS